MVESEHTQPTPARKASKRTAGPTPPPMLHLSDGGHFENLAILPLLMLRLKKIMVVNGGYIKSESCYGKDLDYALQIAREILNCSFTAKNGGDVLTDIKREFVENKDLPRKYEFKVQYSEKERIVEEGEVVILAPRMPKGTESDQEDLGQDWELSDHNLMFCCCICCNKGCGCTGCCEWISNKLCGKFPHHSTGNQFFTPKMFSSYHREGYRAYLEAKDFFPKKQGQEGTAEGGGEETAAAAGREGTKTITTQL